MKKNNLTTTRTVLIVGGCFLAVFVVFVILTKVLPPVFTAVASVINPKPAVVPDPSMVRLQNLIGNETVTFDDGDQIRYELTSSEGHFVRILVKDDLSDSTTFVTYYLDGTIWSAGHKLHTDENFTEIYIHEPDETWIQAEQNDKLRRKYGRVSDDMLRTVYTHFGINSEDGKARVPASVRRQIERSKANSNNK